jgi:hypothetical protein
MMRRFMIFTFSEATLIRKIQVYEFPLLTVRLHLGLMTRDIDQKGF